VQFHRHHVTPEGDVPRRLVVDARTPRHVHMRGTEGAERRCVALQGVVGAEVACTIYAVRPPPCRDFAASYEDGAPAPYCDQARATHGFAPLSPADWVAWHARTEVLDNS
jgi:Fe-S-cluster containining protein